MSTQAKPVRISASEFNLVLCRALFLRGMRSFNPRLDVTPDHFYAWHLSMRQAYVWLEDYFDGDDDLDEARILFVIILDHMYRTSETVEREINFLFYLRCVRSWSPGDGTIEFLMDEYYEQRELEKSPIPMELIDELADRFRKEYTLSYDERSWPEGYDTSQRC